MTDQLSDFDYEATGRFAYDLLSLVHKYDDTNSLYWHPESYGMTFLLLCNDEFYWACSDAEIVTPDDLPALTQAYEDAKAAGSYHGALLWISRKRGLRPQGAMFAYFRTTEEIELFKATGPERPAEFGNPYTIEGALENYGRRDGDTAKRPPVLVKQQADVEETRRLVNRLHELLGGHEGG